jgi:hypothetical protein
MALFQGDRPMKMEDALGTIARVLHLERRRGRCRAYGNEAVVLSATQPPD